MPQAGRDSRRMQQAIALTIVFVLCFAVENSP
jgi:hypothetical protein